MASFRPRVFLQMASDRPLSQTCSKLRNDSIEDSKVDNRLEKINFADLVRDAKSVAGFSPSRQFRVGRNDVTYSPSAEVVVWLT